MSNFKSEILDRQKLISSFNKASETYGAVSRLQKYVGEQLFERLDYLNVPSGMILDLGAGPGTFSRLLESRFSSSGVVQLDIAQKMLHAGRAAGRQFFSRQHYVCADADELPFKDASMDFIFSNLMLQWSQDTDRLFHELVRVIRPGGLLAFSTLGPDTLIELRESWQAADEEVHVNTFIDMHDIGSALIRAGFSDPVLEVEMVELSYPGLSGLLRDLKGLGARNFNNNRRKTLTGKKRFQGMQTAYESKRKGDRLPASYEVIFGHAWIPDNPSRRPDSAGENLFSISLEQIKQTLRNRFGR